jgi:CRISPR-associated endonuclease Csy4
MMKYYQEITIIPSEEIPAYFILSKTFHMLHLAFVEKGQENNQFVYGISFPEYSDKGLGKKLRVFAETEDQLINLGLKEKVQDSFSDYIHITRVRPVPEDRITGYATYSRVQVDSSNERKARRYARRHEDVTPEEALALFGKEEARTNLPYIRMRSSTNQQNFRLFIKKTEKEQTNGLFGSYGLSKTSTVPEFR